MFRDREDAALRLAEMLHRREMHQPIVLGVPRGGVVIGAIVAREIGADLGVILARKLATPTTRNWPSGPSPKPARCSSTGTATTWPHSTGRTWRRSAASSSPRSSAARRCCAGAGRCRRWRGGR